MSTTSKRPMAAEDLYQLQLLTGAELSPDGRAVIYSLQQVDSKDEKKTCHLWYLDLEEGEPRQFTFGKQSDTGARWSPDSRTIAFLSSRGEENGSRLFLIPAGGGEARPLTEALDGRIGDFEWSPDGSRLVVNFQKKDPDEKEREEDEQKKKLGVIDRRITRAFYRTEGVGYEPQEKWHIWTVDVATGEAVQITDGEYDETNPTWSPDGRHILFLSRRVPDWDREFGGANLYLVPAEGGDMRQVPAHEGNKSSPRFSPDGRWIAYFGGRFSPGSWWQNTVLFVTPVDPADGEVRELTSRHDIELGCSTLGDFGSPPPQSPPTWSADGRTIYTNATRHGGGPLLRLRLADGEIETVVDDGTVIGYFNLDRAQEKLLYFKATPIDPCQLYLHDLSSGENRCLTAVNRELLSQIDFGQIEEVWFKGPADNDLHGWILTPPDFDPNKSYPSILYIHGGPLTQYGRTFMHEFYVLAARGYVVFYTNPRGGQGYGEAHAKAISGRWGTADYEDLMAWTDFVGQKPFIDPERMGVCGGSYGGYMTGMIIGMTDHFKAAVPQRMVSNLISFHGTSDFNWGVKYLVGIDGEPWNNLEDYWRMSPISLVGNVRTPTLVIHSEGDLRCPHEQGEQYFVALRLRGIDTELVLFPGENHGLSRGGRTDRRIARMNHIARWFDLYLKNEA